MPEVERAPWTFLEAPARHLFFTGKGGVGKTSIASASAIHLADAGKRVLLVSTDPASNLDEVLGLELSLHPRAVPGVDRLDAMNIDPDVAALEYRERVLGPYREALPDSALRAMEEQLSGACTTEIAAFDEFAVLLGDEERTRAYDHVVFDTAPTGHTLRLLQLPAAWSTFIEGNTSGVSCLGPSSGLKAQYGRYAATVAALADGGRTTLVLVARPERAALREAARTALELRELGILNQHLSVNGVIPPDDRHGVADAIAEALARQAREAIADMPHALAGLPRSQVALRPFDVIGREAFRALATGATYGGDHDEETAPAGDEIPSLDALIDDLEIGGRGLIMTMGKGGVGKTTIAARIAGELARRGHDVLLTTTDPAAHVAEAVGTAYGNLEVGRIDPLAESDAYRKKVLESEGAKLDEEGRALLEEDLRSPCTDEVAVFHAFSRTIAQARRRFVVMDTAPTGHTLLLLDTTGSYHREMVRKLRGGSLTTPLMRLQDPDFTKILIVTLPETTPISEASALQDDLQRAGITPYAWIVNRSLAATGTTHPVLARRAVLERAQIERIGRALAARVAALPLLVPDHALPVDVVDSGDTAREGAHP